jgi:hypothetical protein
MTSLDTDKPLKRKLNPQVKIMGWLSLCFFGGVVAFTLLPEGPIRGIAMSALCGLMLLSMIKGG